MLKAGTARLDITPPLGTPISGYFYQRLTSGVLDPLEVNALAVSDGENTAIMVVSDLIGIGLDKATSLRRAISAKTGVAENSILVSALHQHTSYVLRGVSELGADELDYVDDPAFISVVDRRFVDAAVMAVNDMSEAEVSVAAGETEKQISFIRRYIMKEGPVATNPKTLDPNIVRPAGEPDNTVRLVRFSRKGAKDIALVNFATHPDVVTGSKISADWPGFVRRYIEADMGDVSCVFVNGTQGDVNHVDRFVANQWNDTYEHAALMGRVIADTVEKLWDSTRPVADGKVFADVNVVYTKTRTDDMEKYEECKAFYDAYTAGTLGRSAHITELGFARRVIGLREQPIFRRIPVSVLSFGEVAIVGFGGEPFTSFSNNVRKASPDRFILTSCCTNGYEGYLPSAAAFEEGGYEAASSLFCPTVEKECADAAKELLDKSSIL